MQPVKIEQRQQNGWFVVRVVGAIDVASAPQLRQVLVELQVEAGRRVALDLDGVEFLDSFGLGVIVGGLKRARGSGGELVIVCSRSRIIQLFEVTRLAEIVRIEASCEELGPADDAAS